jgi:hypothetical protein
LKTANKSFQVRCHPSPHRSVSPLMRVCSRQPPPFELRHLRCTSTTPTLPATTSTLPCSMHCNWSCWYACLVGMLA